jgi:MFS family permease
MKKSAVFAICFASSTFGGIVSTLMAVYLPAAVSDLLGYVPVPRMNDIGAAINSAFIFGWMFGGIAWGLICDRIGRARAMAFSTLCYGTFTLLTAAAPSWLAVSVCRFLSGFGVGGVLVTTTILLSETWAGKKRAVMLGILSISIPVGIFSAGLINTLLHGWRQAFLVGIVPLILGIVAFFLKEPEEWKRQEAGGRGAVKLFDEENRGNLWTGSVIFGTMLIGMWAIFSWLPTWVQSVSGGGDAQQKGGISMMMMGAGGLTGGFVSGWVAHAIGVRRTMLLCFAVCFTMAFVLFKLNHAFGVAAYAEVALLAVFFGISQGALSVYIPQLFPTAICAAATGFCFNIGRLFTATAVFFVGALVSFLGGYGNTLFIFSFIFLLGFLATWYAGQNTSYATHQLRK